MAFFFCQYTDEVLDIDTEIIVIFWKLVTDRKTNLQTASISFDSDKAVTITIFINVTHLTESEVTLPHTIISLWRYYVNRLSIVKMCNIRHINHRPSLHRESRLIKKLPDLIFENPEAVLASVLINKHQYHGLKRIKGLVFFSIKYSSLIKFESIIP